MMTTAEASLVRRGPVKADIAISVGFFLIFVFVVWQSFEWSFRAGMFPRMVGTLGLLLCLLNLSILVVQYIRSPQLEPLVETTSQESGDNTLAPDYDFDKVGLKAWLINIIWIAAFFVATYILGLFYAAILFTVAYLKFSANMRWIFSVVYAAVVALFMFLVLDQALHLAMPTGVFY